jgi:hypothetical protein
MLSNSHLYLGELLNFVKLSSERFGFRTPYVPVPVSIVYARIPGDDDPLAMTERESREGGRAQRPTIPCITIFYIMKDSILKVLQRYRNQSV